MVILVSSDTEIAHRSTNKNDSGNTVKKDVSGETWCRGQKCDFVAKCEFTATCTCRSSASCGEVHGKV